MMVSNDATVAVLLLIMVIAFLIGVPVGSVQVCPPLAEVLQKKMLATQLATKPFIAEGAGFRRGMR